MEKKERILGLDFGIKRIGLAITDETQTIAQPLCVIKREGNKKDIEKIREVLQKYDVKKIVLGVSENEYGEVTEIGKKSMAFGEKLKELNVEVEFIEESFTTSIAHEALSFSGLKTKKHKEYIDKIAATLILQDYLRSLNK
ncbi:MAG: Holliday junction resolvase RuvX [Proteobacteria bacterium]|nr:Holliday junction resolvase RuvX [Pseudomonadota bacterium]